MKKLCFCVVIVCYVVAGVLGEKQEVDFSGTFDIQYRSGDSHKASGDDQFKVMDLYLQAKTELAENVYGLLKIDGADLAKETTNASHKYVEEAQIIFKNIWDFPVTIVYGKDEMPYGQDYDKSLYDPLVHQLEIDKVWGINGKYAITKLCSIEAGMWEKSTTEDLAIQKSYTTRLKLNPIPALKASVSFANIGMLNEKDEKRFSAGAIVTINKFLIHGEINNLDDTTAEIEGYAMGISPSLISYGVDYKLTDKIKLKVRHEILDDDTIADTIEGAFQVGFDYWIGKKTALMFEFQNTIGEGLVESKKDYSVGVKVSY